MSSVPVTRTWTPGEIVTAAHFNNNIRDVLNFLLSPPICQVRQIVAQSIPNAATTPLTFTAEDVDSSGMHSTSANTNRLTAVYPGWYQASGAVSWANNTTGRRIACLRVNAIDVTGSFAAYEPTITSVTIGPSRTQLIFLNVGDYAELGAQQSSGGPLLTVVGTSDQPHFTLAWQSN